MGAFQGGLSYRRYTTVEPLPEDFKALYQKGISESVFRPIEPASDEERAIGWTSAHFALDLDLHPEKYRFNEYIVLAMRIDTLTVPGPMLKLYTESEARRVMIEQKRDSLNRYERAEIKERVKMELRRKMLPTVKSIDMVWNVTDGVVRFFSGNEKVNLEFQELFEATFDRLLVPDSPYTAALHGNVALSEAQRAALDDLDPAVFVDSATMTAAMLEA